MLVMRFLADANRISLHDFYRWRLATAYAVIRDTGQQDGKPAPFGTKDLPGALLSQLSGQRPELVMCTTANINAYREVPPGRGGLSFSFDPDHATLRGPGPAEWVQARTADYEALVGQRRFTLFDVSAISGAAFSPLMGAATLQAYRILFTATDLRLGLWLPHPAVVHAAHRSLTTRTTSQTGPPKPTAGGTRSGCCCGTCCRIRCGGAATKVPGAQGGAAMGLCAEAAQPDETRSQQYFGGLLYHALQPTLGMLYAEAVGHTSYRSTWMCVTDGGHYDNLGPGRSPATGAELGITHVLVLDASGDKANTWFTLGGSIALARSDAATEIVLNPTQMIDSARERDSATRPGTSGTPVGQRHVHRPGAGSGQDDPGVQARLVDRRAVGRTRLCGRSSDLSDGPHPRTALR